MAGNMTIKNQHLSEQGVLHHPARPSIEHDLPIFLGEEEEYEFYHITPTQYAL